MNYCSLWEKLSNQVHMLHFNPEIRKIRANSHKYSIASSNL